MTYLYLTFSWELSSPNIRLFWVLSSTKLEEAQGPRCSIHLPFFSLSSLREAGRERERETFYCKLCTENREEVAKVGARRYIVKRRERENRVPPLGPGFRTKPGRVRRKREVLHGQHPLHRDSALRHFVLLHPRSRRSLARASVDDRAGSSSASRPPGPLSHLLFRAAVLFTNCTFFA